MGEDQLPYWKTVEANPAYTPFWQSQALDHLIAAKGLDRPHALGAGRVGPGGHVGRHPQLPRPGGRPPQRPAEPHRHGPVVPLADQPPGPRPRPFEWATDTAEQWRRDYLLPFFNQYLKPGSPKFDLPKALIYNTGGDPGSDHWETPAVWPTVCEKGCPDDLEAALSRRGRRAFVRCANERRHQSSTSTSPTPRTPCPSRRAPTTAPTGARGWSPTSTSSTAAPTC